MEYVKQLLRLFVVERGETTVICCEGKESGRKWSRQISRQCPGMLVDD